MTDIPNLIDVAIPLPLEGPFTYRVPSGLISRVEIGRRVLVPFRNKIRAGFVVGTGASEPGSQEIKEVFDIPEEGPYLTPALWPFIRWVANYYMIPTGQVLKTCLPPGSDRKSRPWAILTPEGRASCKGPQTDQILLLPPKLLRTGVMVQSELDDLIGSESRKEALKRDWIRIEERIARPRLSLRKKKLPELLDPAGTPVSPAERLPELTSDQNSACRALPAREKRKCTSGSSERS
jgi:primosomal protein N'